MLDHRKAAALVKWIQQWEKTYSESPSLNECLTWFEWKFKKKELSKKEKESIETILKFNSYK